MKLLNLNYLRGLYDFLLGKSDEELEEFDINSPANRKVLFEEMRRSFSKFGPIAREHVVDGVGFLIINCDNDDLWRSAIPHDLPLNRVIDRREYLRGIQSALMGPALPLGDVGDFVLIDEVGPLGLDYSK